MTFKDSPIQKKLMTVILLTSGTVLLLTCSAYFAYEFITFRQTTVQQLSTLAEIIATNSTAALAFDSKEDADEILSAVRAEPHIVAAALYDKEGKIFSRFPENLPDSVFPAVPDSSLYQFRESHLIGFQPVIQGTNHLGTLFLKSDMGAMNERLMLYSGIAVLVILISLLIAFLLSRTLQKQISIPILALAYTARAISDRHDYSVRARKFSEDELGLLTDAFNHMLARIQEQTIAISEGETRVRAIINSAMSAVIVIDAAGIIVDWNARAEKMFGWSREDAIGRELAELIIPPQFREAHRKGIQHFLNTGEGPVINQLLEMSALRSDGSEFPAEISISVMKTENKISFCGFVTDITERKQAEEEIRSFNLKLEQKVTERTQELAAANKELEAFSYSVSHDLRAPLRSIHGYMNIFSEEYGNTLDDEGKRLINTVLRNGQKMGQLIDDLLAFSQLGRKELTKSKVSIKDMVLSIWEEQKRTEKGRKIKFILNNIDEAFADQVTMRQVWTNFISNAIKYTKTKEEAIIEIGSEDRGNELVYYIKDNGAGFDMKYYDKLFGVFQRLHSFHEFEGTGVGLAIVQRVISKHGGKIWAEAEVNKGATFYFSLKKN